MQDWNQLHHYIDAIQRLPADKPLTKQDLLIPDFLLHREGGLEMYYAPHNEYINQAAKLVILGITPGWTQMELAFRQAKQDVDAGLLLEQIAYRSKQAARFAGTMRKNLCSMLDQIELNTALGLSSCTRLFEDQDEWLHTSSVIKYPVFSHGLNYTGHNPQLVKSQFLSAYVCSTLNNELKQLANPLLIPLGKMVEDALNLLVSQGVIERQSCLSGFPHPSGANGHRLQQLKTNLPLLKKQVIQFFN
ncbi:hypothetical protein [Paenibacillus sp. FSL H8-0034]|uniref:hypothetical protein n=1 Tax=Paenibacillus sp. FSL H8-0034 TaxID=2954671 RepID=UPI0030F72C5B